MKSKEFYDSVAESWYNIRHWTIFRQELEKLNKEWSGSLLNVGCAHGADFVPFSPGKFRFFGMDSSKELVFLSRKYAQKSGLVFHNCVGDMRELPFTENSVDYVICIASLHHLLEREERLQALKEMKRVLRKEAFITVWDIRNSDLPDDKIIEREWNRKGEVLKRLYYLYDKDELRKDLEEAGLPADVWSDGRNVLALVKLK